MLEGRSDSRVVRLIALLETSLAGRLDVPTVDFRYLDFRLDGFEITVSPPPRLPYKKLASAWATIQRCAQHLQKLPSDTQVK
jgi:hypothetical protein